MRNSIFCSLLVLAYSFTIANSSAIAGEIGFIEEFSLAKDRAEVLKKLIPGTEEYYYYYGLHYLNTAQSEKIEALIKPWLERFGQTPRLTEIQTRRALLTYDADAKKSLDYLRNHLGLNFNHQKETVGAIPNLPTAIDSKRISQETLLAESLTRWQNLENFEDSALDWLDASKLDAQKLRNYIQRLKRPDVANLTTLLDQDFKNPNPVPFGSYPIHLQLTLIQLEEMQKARPELLNQSAFVNSWISHLQPGGDSDWKRNPKEAEKYLDRLHNFVTTLAPVHNSLKAHILYHRLALDRARGIYNHDRFMLYLSLPRQQAYMAKVMLEKEENNRFPAQLGSDFSAYTLLPRIDFDEPLVRSYLKHFFLDMNSAKEFEPYINDVYLRHLFAETKIENGLGDVEQWASQLPPEKFKEIRERIDIEFSYASKTDYAADEPVALDLHIKNVPSLLVKVFEINTLNFYKTQLQEIETNINLDGLVANSEKTTVLNDGPFKRVTKRFEFPELNKKGVYIIDFIGAGKSSRALIHKGKLRTLSTTGPNGQVLTILDETKKVIKDAVVWLGGQEYKAEKDGTITLPYSNGPGNRAVVISHQGFSSLDRINHLAESYELQAGFHIDRESLLSLKTTQVMIRPSLRLNGFPVSIKMLEEVRLLITSTDLSGIASTAEVADFKLFEDRESFHEIRVPARLSNLNVTLVAKVKNLSLGKSVDLAASHGIQINQIDRSEKIEDLHFAKFGNDYVIELLGRTGESKIDRSVNVSIKHRDFKTPIQFSLKTDKQGRINLGPLLDIFSVTATGPEATSHNWILNSDNHTFRQLIHSKQGETISIPHMGTGVVVQRFDYALFELSGSTNRKDFFASLSIKEGMLEISGLVAGDYDLWLKRTGEKIRIRVVEGVIESGFVLGNVRQLRLPELNPVQIQSVETNDKEMVIKLNRFSKVSRLHLFATRYQPEFSAYQNLGKIREPGLDGIIPGYSESVYLAGRNIGDEYRYVLDRKGQKKYPGNMLERPMLLLNPWAIRSTQTGEQAAVGGEEFDRQSKGEGSGAVPPVPTSLANDRGAVSNLGGLANLDFLADASSVLLNLIPDKDGFIKIPRKALGTHSMIQLVAVDPVGTTIRSVYLAEQPASYLDLRLRNGLDPQKHFTQQKQVSVLAVGQVIKIEDLAGSRFETYDTLGKVYNLYSTLSKNATLQEFSFLTTWFKLKLEEKKKLYSKYSCHELNFFLLKKDNAFFKEVVFPYLANKKDKTFMDQWFLQLPLDLFLEPWHYERLNMVERVLLAQRIKDQELKTRRHLDDMFRILPPNLERLVMLFDTSIKVDDLSDRDQWGVAAQKLKLDSNRELGEKKAGEFKNQDMGGQGFAGGVGGGALGGIGGGKGPAPGAAVPPRNGAAANKLADSKEAAKSMRAKDGKGGDPKGDSKMEQEDAAKDQLNAMDKLSRSEPESLMFRKRALESTLKQLFMKVDPTMEWAENNYYHLPIQTQVANLVGVNSFWKDYANHDLEKPFLSKYFPEASRNFTEMMFALSVLDLPNESKKHEVKFEAGSMEFKPATSVIAFHEEVRPAEALKDSINILVSQNFYKQGDRYRDENGEKFDKFIASEFVVHTVYGCQVVVTNPTSSKQKLTVLLQLPAGSIALANGQFTSSVLVNLEPYRTQTIDYFFYFPMVGKFNHFPVHIAKNEKYVASAKPFIFEVVAKPSKLDISSWDYVSQQGTNEEVLAFLERENVRSLNLTKIAFRLRDKKFLESVLNLLEARHLFNQELWAYGIYHDNIKATRQFLLHSDRIIAECGGPIDSKILTYNPLNNGSYEFLEYKPLVNARAHSLGQARQIVNDRFLQQYQASLKLLSYQPRLNDTDALAITYYLLLQDRVDEALAYFNQVDAKKIATPMQYDYCRAYLDFYSEEYGRARTLAQKYIDHPVDKWKNTFATIVSQLDEAEGKNAKVNDPESKEQKQALLAASESSFDFNIDSQKINLNWQNLSAVTINYYLMDVELLFSRNPFVQQSGNQFAFIKPNKTQLLELGKGQSKLAINLPAEYLRKNVLVEISANGKSTSLPYYANAMTVQLIENYGQIKVLDSVSSKPLAKVYVKVYSRTKQGVKFHKDGYTDVRGRFDYASVSTPENSPIEKFSVLILSEQNGAMIREANPPQQ